MKIEYFIIVFFLFVLLFYAYRLYKYEKIYIDVWLYNQIMLFFPYFVLYPWAGDSENEGSVGYFINVIRVHLPQAFMCNCVGFIALWLGKYIYDSSNKKNVMCKFDKIVNKVMFNDRFFLIFICLYLPFILVVVSLLLRYRGEALLIEMRTGMLQTCANIAVCGLPHIFLATMIMFIERKNKKYLIGIVVCAVILTFMGRRGVLLSPIVSIVLMVCVYKGRNLQIYKVIIFAIAVLNLVFILADLRSDKISNQSLIDKILYGNSFCDVRDFAWILSGFNEDFFFGKTYLAGLMSFIPSAYSDFRVDWSFGHVSLRLAGLYDGGWTEHGGLRGGIFCEAYLNFGYLGIIIIAMIKGYISEWINTQHKYYCKKKQFSLAYSCTVKGTIVSCFLISSNAWTLYGFIIPIILVYKIKQKEFLRLC